MKEDTRTRLTQIFGDHTSVMDTAARKRESRDREEKRLEEEFRNRFEAHCSSVILPLLEDLSREVRKNGHGATVTSTTHGKFFSGPDDAPGVIFMFYPDSVGPEDYVLKPMSSHVAVFADVSQQNVQLHARAVLPGGFTPGKSPEVLPLSEVTTELLAGTCIDVIEETLHRMEPGRGQVAPSPSKQGKTEPSRTGHGR